MPHTEIIYPDGSRRLRQWAKGERPAYQWLRRAIAAEGQENAYIESLAYNVEDGLEVYGNEEGRLIELAANPTAMKQINWPEPPEGWARYDGHMGNQPMVQVFTTPEELQAARKLRQWSPVVGPVLVMTGFGGTDEMGEYTDKEINPEDLGAMVPA
ncbi:MAG TPA: hypothetical protein VM537_07385 [Anaerolineae bacterium]|nr:hypothetical protein [Anaerolineae bacterium]